MIRQVSSNMGCYLLRSKKYTVNHWETKQPSCDRSVCWCFMRRKASVDRMQTLLPDPATLPPQQWTTVLYVLFCNLVKTNSRVVKNKNILIPLTTFWQLSDLKTIKSPCKHTLFQTLQCVSDLLNQFQNIADVIFQLYSNKVLDLDSFSHGSI